MLQLLQANGIPTAPCSQRDANIGAGTVDDFVRMLVSADEAAISGFARDWAAVRRSYTAMVDIPTFASFREPSQRQPGWSQVLATRTQNLKILRKMKLRKNGINKSAAMTAGEDASTRMKVAETAVLLSCSWLPTTRLMSEYWQESEALQQARCRHCARRIARFEVRKVKPAGGVV